MCVIQRVRCYVMIGHFQSLFAKTGWFNYDSLHITKMKKEKRFSLLIDINSTCRQIDINIDRHNVREREAESENKGMKPNFQFHIREFTHANIYLSWPFHSQLGSQAMVRIISCDHINDINCIRSFENILQSVKKFEVKINDTKNWMWNIYKWNEYTHSIY